MMQALLVSNVLLWVVVVALAGVVAALVRQIGVLYERVAPAGALVLGRGPEVGRPAPVVRVADLRGQQLEVGAPSARVYLGSPYTVAASAVAGRIADPRELLG